MNLYQRAAELCYLVYGEPEAIRKHRRYSNVCYIDSEETETQAVICEDADYIYIVFAGTDEREDTRTDLRFAMTEGISDYNLHTGFFRSWQDVSVEVGTEVYQRVVDSVHAETTPKKVITCGHSLGGALAVLAGLTYDVDHVITFGQPHVGGKNLAAEFEERQTRYSRFVYDGDPVPRLLTWHPKYRHGGDLIFLDRDYNAHRNPSLWKQLKLQFPWVFDISDHSVHSYFLATYVAGVEL